MQGYDTNISNIRMMPTMVTSRYFYIDLHRDIHSQLSNIASNVVVKIAQHYDYQCYTKEQVLCLLTAMFIIRGCLSCCLDVMTDNSHRK